VIVRSIQQTFGSLNLILSAAVSAASQHLPPVCHLPPSMTPLNHDIFSFFHTHSIGIQVVLQKTTQLWATQFESQSPLLSCSLPALLSSQTPSSTFSQRVQLHVQRHPYQSILILDYFRDYSSQPGLFSSPRSSSNWSLSNCVRCASTLSSHTLECQQCGGRSSEWREEGGRRGKISLR